MADIVVVTKDIVEFQIYQPVVSLLRRTGHIVYVLAEGLSFEKWLAAGEEVIGGRPSVDRRNAETGCRYDLNEHELLGEMMPDLVLAGLGSPNNLGERFGLAANERGIKLGYVTDVWGAESRSKATPDFICTLDPFGKKKIESWAPYQGRMPHIHVTGSPAMDRLKEVREKGAEVNVCDMIHQRQNSLTYLLAGQDESTTPVIDGLIRALDQVGDYVLIPRLHPKFMGRDDCVVPWLKALAKAKGEVLWVGPRVTTQELAGEVDVVVSVYSNALIEAAALGSLPVSWVSGIGRASMSKALGGLERFPLVDCGCAIEVSSADEFVRQVVSSGKQCWEVLERCGKQFPCDGKNTERVVAAIEAELPR